MLFEAVSYEPPLSPSMMPPPVALGPPPLIQLPVIWIGFEAVPLLLYMLIASSGLLDPKMFSPLLLVIALLAPLTVLNCTNCPRGKGPTMFLNRLLFTMIPPFVVFTTSTPVATLVILLLSTVML